MQITFGLPRTVLADTGFASGPTVAELQARRIKLLGAIGRTQMQRPYDFRPPSLPRAPRRITEPWRLAVKSRLESEDAKALYKRRKQNVEPVFGIIKSAMGFVRYRVDPDRPRPQLPTHQPHAGRVIRPCNAIIPSHFVPNPTGC